MGRSESRSGWLIVGRASPRSLLAVDQDIRRGHEVLRVVEASLLRLKEDAEVSGCIRVEREGRGAQG